MNRIFSKLFGPVVLGTLAVLVLSALVWWVGPLIGIGDHRPLDPTWVRVLLLALLWLGWIGRLVWRAWRRKRTNAALIQGMSGGVTAGDREAQVLAERFDEAMTRLKGASGRSLLQPGAYLYELPWYMFIGAPGSGKTTALMNAGLQFLLGDGKQGAEVRGVGGTRNCDWWFTREAVLIDTAGRYTLQESDDKVDAQAWDSFLGLLKKTRPRQPINGVLLTVNVQDLLQQGAPERAQHAAKLRERLHELQTKLGVRAPVYVLVTKVDLIAGFNENFADLPKEERDQVWGFTLPWQEGALVNVTTDVTAAFDSGYAGLEQRLGERMPERLLATRDPQRRAAAFGFHQEFAALRGPLREFLATVFASGGSLQATPPVRGVYFTSGTQEGTPIDRVMGALGRSFGLTRRASASLAGQGRSYFLLQLLHDLVFVERGLGVWNAGAERRRRVLYWSGVAGLATLSVALLVGWAVSYTRNGSYAEEVAAGLPKVQQALAAVPPAPQGDVTVALAALTEARNAAAPADFPVDQPPALATFGLYQGNKLDAGARLGYERALPHALAPRIAARLQERLRAASRDNLENAYEALKSYLMLYSPNHFDADSLRAWIGSDWDQQYARSLTAEQRQQLDAHLDALLALGAPAAIAPMDQNLVASVREMLVAYPLEYRVFSRLKRQSRGSDAPEFSVAAAAGPDAAKVFTRASGEPLTRGIPGLYTRDGYRRSFQSSLALVASKLAAEESWVLGVPADPQRQKDALLGDQLNNRVRRLFLEEYIKVWDKYLADVKLVQLGGLAGSIEASRLLASPDSPLTKLTRRIAEETTLVPPPAEAPSGLAGAAAALSDKVKQAKADAAKLSDGGAAPAAGGGAAVEQMVDDHFASYRRLVTGNPAPIDDTRKLFEELNLQLVAIDAAQKSKAPPPAGGGGGAKLKAAAGQQPELIRGVLETLADAGERQGRNAERDLLTADLRPITEFCQRAIANRYPFAANSRADVLPEDFGQLFGNGGMLDDFFQRRLQPLVDTGTASWSYKPLPDGTRPAAPAALAEFQRAARIREVFFRGGGKAPGFRVDIRAGELADGLKELSLDIDGQHLILTAGSTAQTITWPSTRVASQIKLNTAPALATPLSFDGPWALFRLFERFEVQPGAQPEKFSVLLNLEGRRARLDVTAASVFNPFRLREISQFRCPGAM
ncbi:type VI secretion system membrane subunit TssM [Roseateles saccharophilus]|uniref:Type VI secretion system protein ImpL n=1 Tax=Roseateles saccharophilus TaxID=304 RepID=A0A4R3UZ08_ROSSA|nr:type VI secretion system membrane subunit TssM [Roseateles saccharophilus]MDG0835664.1 type VI secretion system membrane subunit TssM [Roseateles saccharophilus]TCU96321.1 type VI secretion system protein ImpL [Roseateles saccharophilus]